MAYNSLTIKRSYVLGDIYKHCDPIESIPVYMNDQSGEPLGHVDESMGHYADAFTFHLSEAVCKQLSASHFDYAFGFEYTGDTEQPGVKKRIKLKHIVLLAKKPLFNKKVVFKEVAAVLPA